MNFLFATRPYSTPLVLLSHLANAESSLSTVCVAAPGAKKTESFTFTFPLPAKISTIGTGSTFMPVMDVCSSKRKSSQQPPRSEEAEFYYSGLPSRPRLVSRSSTNKWTGPCWPDAYNKPKELRPVGMHAIVDVWEDHLSHKFVQYLDSKQVSWTSIDILRIGYAGDPFPPLILWIGVKPDSLSFEDGMTVACTCHEILVESRITDVDVEIRESSVIPLVGPKLLTPTLFSDATTAIRNPLTPMLGISISPKHRDYIKGTGGVFLAEGGGSNNLLLLTARHVVLEDENEDTYHYNESDGEPPQEILLLGDSAFRNFIQSIEGEIKEKQSIISYLERRMKRMTNQPGKEAERYLQKAGQELVEAQEALGTVESFLKQVSGEWASPEGRILGHVSFSPSLEFGWGEDEYTRDFALIEVDASKINGTNFTGNMIDLGTKISPYKLTEMMCPDVENSHSFEYPVDGFLKVSGTIPQDEIRRPPSLKENRENFLMVMKHGIASGLTVGRASGLRSVVHNYLKGGISKRTMEWAILQYDTNSGPFSVCGDSGACVVDGGGRLGGIITSGAGQADGTDVTYASSINSIMVDVRAKFPRAHLNPQLNRD